ncbi:MAG: L-2-hydroxyglutarate oxidase [Nitrospirae bacterium]|nr:L-2-hydroxyglutarate oxidase [Nitrospirota bacterium]MBF0541885.1 L-2-hydroxyglutarate oxidase [Nitrospirota bacterium]
MKETDILITGAGIVGLSIAREINKRYSDLRITIIEKEPTVGLHASGRNSGVLHAGFYYSPDSLKAKLTVQGNALMTAYCQEFNLPINQCGKVVVTKNEGELEGLYELKKRGDTNGVELSLIDEYELSDIEPNAKTVKHALFSKNTSTVDPLIVVNHISKSLIESSQTEILFNERYLHRLTNDTIQTNNQKIKFRHLINTSGLYADKVAHDFNTGYEYILVPFKGLYVEYKDDSLLMKHIYPVPNLKNPFLGVHFTKTVKGHVKIGPTAIPAYWRENYGGMDNFDFSELIQTFSIEARLFVSNASNFRDIAFDEMRKYFQRNLIKEASQLVKKIDASSFGGHLKPGIRAQLLDRKDMKLVMDFVIVEAENSTHILNAVSPAFTCAFSFSSLVVDKMNLG